MMFQYGRISRCICSYEEVVRKVEGKVITVTDHDKLGVLVLFYSVVFTFWCQAMNEGIIFTLYLHYIYYIIGYYRKLSVKKIPYYSGTSI